MKKEADIFNLSRFKNTQILYNDVVLEELKAGRKQSCWMWFMFPQLKDLGYSENAKYYGIASIDEAKAYIADKALKNKLMEMCEILLGLQTNDAEAVFGWPDNKKLQSCMTLFEKADSENLVYGKILDKFFNGERDQKTLDILNK